MCLPFERPREVHVVAERARAGGRKVDDPEPILEITARSQSERNPLVYVQ